MKNTMTIIGTGLLVLVGASLIAQSDEELFARANTLYEQHAYQDALHQYATITKPTAAVWYNCGNAAYRMGKIGMALAFWRRSQQQAGWRASKDLYDNIALVRMQAREKAIHSDQLLANIPFWWQMLQVIAQPLRSVPTSLLQVLFLLLFVCCFVAFKIRKHWFFTLASITIVCAGLLSAKYAIDGRKMAIVVVPHATLYSGPGTSFCALATLPEATEVYVALVREGFCKVQAYGLRGWLASTDLQDV